MNNFLLPRWVKPAATAGFTLLILILGNCSLGPLPALGKFFNPFSGFWQNAEMGQLKDGKLRIKGLQETVTAVFDQRGVPHIFAQNDHDLYMAQGYLTARDRLWQMEIQTMAAAGRLAEILGPSMIEHDRFQRRLGMVRGAEQALELFKRDGDSWQAAEAYAQGVNAYIGTLSAGSYPIEYKLLGYAPEIWTPLKTALLIKHMQWTLSGMGDDLPMTNTLGKFGADFMRKFFPARVSDVQPIIPSGTAWSFTPAKVPGGKAAPDSVLPVPVPEARPDPENGSNNFVIGKSRSRGGYPILANDPHLDLGLPALWYEVQLSAPGISTYGVSLPGAPGLLIGFNRKIAWGLTNGNDDVFDWYRIQFRDSTLSEYSYGGQWKPTRKVVEIIGVKGKAPVLDTVIYTHQGPLVLKSQERPANRNSPSMHALRWLALDPSDELAAFLRITRANNFAEFAAALEPFHCPAQNFAYADVSGDIAMLHHGLLPLKWNGQGRFTLDGSVPGNDWMGWIPSDQDPRCLNPAQGWLSSSNQSPTDSTYPYYLGAEFINGERAKRLGRLLAETDSATVDTAFKFLMDDYDVHAEEVLPTLLSKINRAALGPGDSAALQNLSAWNFRHDPGKKAPALFDQWWRLLYKSIWQDEFAGDSVHYQWPSKDRTRRMILDEPDAIWFDDITTPVKENLATLVNRSFHEACGLLRENPSWARYRPVKIKHLAQIDAFSRLQVATGGCADCVNALKASHGPSWRMVVALDKQPHGYGIYPGGQSGNPGSPRYDNFIDDWAAGKFYNLAFLDEPGSGGNDIAYRLLLRSK